MRILMTALAVVTAAGFAVAQPAATCPTCPKAGAAPMMAPGPAGMPEMPNMPPDMPALPELTNEQWARFDALRMDHVRAMMPLRTNLQVKEMELAALWRADDVDAKKVTSKVREISDLRGQIELERVNHILAVREILTPEQRKSFKPGMGMGRGMHGMMRGMRGMGGTGPMMGPGQCPMGGGCGGDCGSD